MPFKFIHTADIHLDSPLKSLALRNPDLAELIGNASRQVFVNTVTLCIEEHVDALLIAGDLYDGEQKSMKTARFLADQMRRLSEADIRVFIIRGNHDAASKITRELILPDNVKVFTGGSRATSVALDRPAGEQAVNIHGLSFARPIAKASLLPKYKIADTQAINIGMMHTSLDGAEGHDSYAPCKLADLQTAGFDYWALGHIHKRNIVQNSECVVVMPGIPQGRDIGESGAKSVTQVSIDDNGQCELIERHTSIAQFDRVAVDIAGADNVRDVVDLMVEQLVVAREQTESEHLITRLVVTGVAPVAWSLRRDVEWLQAQIEERAAQLDKIWLDKIELRCESPQFTRATVTTMTPAASPLLELSKLITDDVIPSSAFAATLMQLAEELRGQLPAESKRILEADDEQALASLLRNLSQQGADDTIARLHLADPGADWEIEPGAERGEDR